MATTTNVNVPKLKLKANEINQQIQVTERSIIQKKQENDDDGNIMMSQRSNISYSSTQRSAFLNNSNNENKSIEELKREKDMLNRKLYQLMNTIQLAEAEMSSHKIQDISKAPTRKEAAKAFFKNRYGTTSQQTYAFSAQMSNLNKTLLPTNRNRRRRNDGTEHAEVAARTIAGQMNR